MWNRILEIVLATDDALIHLVQEYGILTYAILFLIIYAETGLLFFPFLPGDGLIFSIGVLAGLGHLDLFLLIGLLITAAYLGNLTSYYLGRYSSKYLLRIKSNRWRTYLDTAQEFYGNYGGNAVLFARFFPVLRTYVPFIAGIAIMKADIFLRYSLFGALLWVLIFLLAGYFLGEIKWVQQNYGLIFVGLIILTMLPLPIRFLVNQFKKKNSTDRGPE